jgi:hypothetical protein
MKAEAPAASEPFQSEAKMSDEGPKYFELPLNSLRVLADWCADCAEIALPVFEKHVASDIRSRQAIEGARVFAAGGKRAAQLRTLSLAAFAAAREAGHPAAAAAARAAGLAASSAYTHPLADVEQTKHIVGPAAYAALALELDPGGDSNRGDDVISWAIARATTEVRDILSNMPARPPGKSRLDLLMYDMDKGIRDKMF